MKKFAYVIAALAAAFAVSCTKETPLETPNTDAPAEVGMKEVTITASVDPETKTSYDATGAFSWHKGDQISVMGTDKIFYTLTAQSSGASTTFRGMVPEGVTLRQEAFFPANPNIRRDGDSYFFTIAETKDLTATGSADLPMGAYSGTDNYVFKHVTGAALFTFTNFPSNVVAAEVTFANKYVKLHGEFKTYTSEGLWTWGAKDINADKTDGTYTRKVTVTNGQAQVYLPYPAGGTIWNEIAIKVVGFTANGKELNLLDTKTTSQLPAFERAVVQKIAPLALPDYIDFESVDWNADNVASVTNAADAACKRLQELKVVCDNKHMYVRITVEKELPFDANFLDIRLTNGDADVADATMIWDQWPGTKGTNHYKKEHKGTIDANGELTSMIFNHTDGYHDITYSTSVSDNTINWYLAYPLDYVKTYKSSTDNKVYVGFILWKDYDFTWGIPAKGWGQSMLEVTLP